MSNTVELRKRKDLLVVEDLHMVYKVGKLEVPALRGVDIRIKESEFVAIMGPSGCGKSTLLHLLGGLLRPTSGRIFIGNTDISRISDGERTELRRRNVGFVFQRFNLLPTLSAKDNIDLANRIRRNSRMNGDDARRILKLLGLESKMDHKPAELSGGEQQRVAIARAIISRPKILLADEPTGNLDSDNSQMVLQMLQELNLAYNQTIVMITHDWEVASNAGRIIEMRDGKVLNRVENLFYAMEQTRLS
ncbi:MAG: ABC transporter ATP-binding protein [Acidobacteriota bacterium]